jgi:flagellar assembly factor FliW
VAEEQTISMTAPLPPFVGLERYVLLPDPEEEPFSWLQSLDEPAVVFVLLPLEALGAATPELTPALREELGLAAGETLEAYAIVSLADEPSAATVNLLAPVVVCRSQRRGRQIIHEGDLSLARVPLQ